jgi:hypothetical protein
MAKSDQGKNSYISLFNQRRLKGWWPCIMELADNKRQIAVNLFKMIKALSLLCLSQIYFQGKVEMEIEILTEEEALRKPAGRGRENPNMNPVLDPPQLIF